MRKAFKFQLKISEAIEQRLTNTLDVCRELANAAIQERRDAYRIAGKSITYADQSAQLPDIKLVRDDLKHVYSQVLQDTLKRVERSFENFFRRVKQGVKPGFPRFKSKDRYDSFTYPQGGWKLEDKKLTLSKIGSMRVRFSQAITGKIKTVTLKREADRWFVIFSCEMEAQPQPLTGKAIAVDVNLENFYTDSNGKRVENPKYFRITEKRIAKAQRQLAKKKRGSKKRLKAKRKLTKLHTKVKNQRKDFAHKQSRKLIDKYDLIVYENLNITGMVSNHHLSKSIRDVGWGMFFEMLDYKAANAGKLAMDINPYNTSQECSGCGKKVPKALSVRWHKCPYCGLELSRDQNAARNILARGIELLLAGGHPVTAPGGLALAGLLKGEPSHTESSAGISGN